MQNYTAQTLLSELQNQGVVIQPASGGNLFVDGEMTAEQLEAVKVLKPQIINAINKNQTFRFAENEYLLWDMEKCLQIFSVENESACRVAGYIAKKDNSLKENGKDSICFCYPTSSAYIAALKLAEGVLMNESGEITGESLKTIADEFIKSHLLTNQISDWMQERDAPLWQIKILFNSEQLDNQIGNAVQVAIIAAVWAAMEPECHTEIKKA